MLPITGLTEPRPGDDGGAGSPQAGGANGAVQQAPVTQAAGVDGGAQQSPVAQGGAPEGGAIEVQVGGEEPASLSVAVGAASEVRTGSEAGAASAEAAQSLTGTAAGASGSSAESVAEEAAASAPSPEDNSTVLRVRSPVSSYWRGQVYSQFRDGRWVPDSGVTIDLNRGSTGFAGRYTQTHYVVEEQPGPHLGYTSLGWSTLNGSEEDGVLEEGTVYQALSQRLPFDPATLRRLAEGSRANRSTPGISCEVRGLAGEIVAGTDNPFDRSTLIAQYLRDNYTYRPSPGVAGAPRPSEAFLFEGDGSGDGLDFAAAHALLARAAGLQSRLVTGYLPGEFNPLSGAHTVRRSDAHAWSELRFPGVGWVPFDASPRLDLPSYGAGRDLTARAVNKVFQWQIGDTVKNAFAAFFDTLTSTVAGALAVGFGIVSLTSLIAIFYLRRRRRPRIAAYRYSALPGTGRKAVLQAYRRVEKGLRRLDIAPRAPSETVTAYLERVAAAAPHLVADLTLLGDTVIEAAYRPDEPTSEDAAQARLRAGRIVASLRASSPLG